MFKKTLQVKLENTLQNVPLVLNPVSSVLNKEETLSVQDKVLACNNLEVDLLPQHTGDQNLRVSDNVYVFVLNKRKEPLMPTSCRKAKLLLKHGRAVVVKRFPFTIQLTYTTGENKQKITCGIDSGYSYIGFSCITKKQELIRGEVELDNSTSKHLTERRMYRRLKRNKLRYRKPKFLNRKRADNWLPPSVGRRYKTHITITNKLKQLLPISDTVVEVANFDIQKLNNPDISGVEYQQGNLYNYENMKAFLLCREKHICQLCGKSDSKTDKWKLHHIIPRSKGGTDKSDNMALLHKSCHKKLHKEGLYNKLKKSKQYKESAFMNIVKNRFKIDLDCKLVYGYETFIRRNELKINKSHSNDSFVIAGGVNQSRSVEYLVNQKRKNNRSLQTNRKGFKPAIRRQRYKIQPHDLIKVENNIYEVITTHSCGKAVTYKIDNKTKKDISTKKISWFFNSKTLIFKKGGCVNSSRI